MMFGNSFDFCNTATSFKFQCYLIFYSWILSGPEKKRFAWMQFQVVLACVYRIHAHLCIHRITFNSFCLRSKEFYFNSLSLAFKQFYVSILHFNELILKDFQQPSLFFSYPMFSCWNMGLFLMKADILTNTTSCAFWFFTEISLKAFYWYVLVYLSFFFSEFFLLGQLPLMSLKSTFSYAIDLS